MSLNDIYTFWFNSPQFWFNSSQENDKLITEKFKQILDNPPKISYEESHAMFHEESIGYILLYDQITRHINRNSPEIVNEHLKKIIPFVLEFYQTNKKRISSTEFGFVLLPLRHLKTYDKFLFVILEAWTRLNSAKTDTERSDYTRFLKASYERYLKFSMNDDIINIEHFNPTKIEKLSDSNAAILDKRCDFEKIKLTNQDKLQKIYNITDYLDPEKKYILSFVWRC